MKIESKSVVIIVSCLSACVLISLLVTIYFCKRKKVLCFSNSKRNNEAANEAYALSVSRVVSNATKGTNESTSATIYVNYTKEAQDKGNPSTTAVDRASGVTFSSVEGSYNSNCQKESDSHHPMQGFISSLTARYENLNPPSEHQDTPKEGESDDDEFQSSEQMANHDAEATESTMCWAIHDFEPMLEGYSDMPGLLRVSKNEVLILIQKDLGSGWACVRSPTRLLTGFVPSHCINEGI